MSLPTEELLAQLKQHGYEARTISAEHIRSLKEEIEGRYKQGQLNKEFYAERLAWFDFRLPENLPKAQSLIVVAVPGPQTQATFTWNGKPRPLLIPPTYTAYDETRQQVEDLLAKILFEKQGHVARTALPLKLLATRSGLGVYGRNNVVYVPGMGSFLQLVAAYSDLACEKDSWQETQMMKNCEHCQLCRQRCPTEAIPSDRFLLRAERCIVFHNEKKGDVPFPAWMNPSWHNCVVGCLHCQKICPQNKNFLQWIGEKEEFSEEETALLLKGASRDQLPIKTIKKLEHLSIIDYLDSLPRNLQPFFRNNTPMSKN
jgi:epoxyqueuosine reductase